MMLPEINDLTATKELLMHPEHKRRHLPVTSGSDSPGAAACGRRLSGGQASAAHGAHRHRHRRRLVDDVAAQLRGQRDDDVDSGRTAVHLSHRAADLVDTPTG